MGLGKKKHRGPGRRAEGVIGSAQSDRRGRSDGSRAGAFSIASRRRPGEGFCRDWPSVTDGRARERKRTSRFPPGRRPDGLWNRRNFPQCGIPGGWGRRKRPFAGRGKGRTENRHSENGRRDPPERLYCRRRAVLPSDTNWCGRFCHPAAGSGAGTPAKDQSFFFSVSFSNFCMLRNLARQES